MGMRSVIVAPGRPVPLAVAAGAQAAEAALLGVAVVFSAVATATPGVSYRESSGVAFTVLEFIVAAGLAWIAVGVARLRPWSRTPAVMTQLCTGVVGIWLLQAHRLDWGVPAAVLAIAGLAGLLAPASLKALNRPGGAPPASPQDDPPVTPRKGSVSRRS
jgi:hypothetical protein